VATHKSAKKRARQSLVRRERNREYISRVRTTVKKLHAAVAEGKSTETIDGLFRAAQAVLARAASKGILHRSNAARRIGRLSAAIKSAATGEKTAAAKPAKAKAAKAKAAPKAEAAPKKKTEAAKKKAKPAKKKS